MDLVNLKQFNRLSKLNQTNWIIWQLKFKSALRKVGLWSGVIEDPDDQKVDFNVLDMNARLLIGLWVEDSLVPIIQDSFQTSAHMMWQTLKVHFGNDETTEVDDDLTKPDLTTREIAFHPILQTIKPKRLLTVNKIFYNQYDETIIYVASYKKHYYRIIQHPVSRISSLIELKVLMGLNIIRMVGSISFSLALTDSGDLYVIYENLINNSEREIKTDFVLSDVKKVCSQRSCCKIYVLKSDGRIYTFDSLEPFVPFWSVNIKDISVSSFGLIALTDDEQILCKVNLKNKPIKIENLNMQNPKSVHGGHKSFLVLTQNGAVHYYRIGKSGNKIRNELISTPEAIELCYDISSDYPNYCLVSISGDCYVWLGEQKKLIRSITRSIPDTINLYGKSYLSTKNDWTELPAQRALQILLNEDKGFSLPRHTCPNFEFFSHAFYYHRYNAIQKTPITIDVINQALELLREHQKSAEISKMDE